MNSWWRRRYGSTPLHLVEVMACFAVAGIAIAGFVDLATAVGNFAVWFAGAIVFADFVLLPAYTVVDRLLVRAVSRGRRDRTPPPRALNYIRIPLALSGLMFLIDFPLILRLSRSHYHAAFGLQPDVYLARWLIASGVVFAVSALLYALGNARVRRRGSRRRGRRTSGPRRSSGPRSPARPPAPASRPPER